MPAEGRKSCGTGWSVSFRLRDYAGVSPHEELLFGDGLQVVETALEMPPDNAIHVPKNAHDFHDVEICTAHGPRYLCGGSRRFESKLIDVMGFKGLDEIH